MYKHYTNICILFLFFFSGCATKRFAVPHTPQEIRSAVENQLYQFLAKSVQPASGRSREITGATYFLKVTKQEISADLPYFGRAYSAPIGSDGGIKFQSNDFTYQEDLNKKGAREVAIRINHSQVVTNLNLTIFEDGTADLRITPTNRRFISYRGSVSPLEN
jgi:hypothetical protein